MNCPTLIAPQQGFLSKTFTKGILIEDQWEAEKRDNINWMKRKQLKLGIPKADDKSQEASFVVS